MTERKLSGGARRRLAVLRHVEELSLHVAATCRYYGISRQCYYGWLRATRPTASTGRKTARAAAQLAAGHPGGGDREDRVPAEARPFGPAKIAMYLARYHDVTISTSGVWRI